MRKFELTRRSFVGNLLGAGVGAAVAPSVLATGGSPRVLQGMAAARDAHPQDSAFVLCVFSKHLPFLDFAELADVAAGIGFDGVDLTVRPGGHVEPENAARDLPLAVGALRSAGLQVPTITTAITAADQAYARDVLETARALEIPGYRLGYLQYDARSGVAATLDGLKPQLESLAALNEELGIHGDYQNHDGEYVGAPVWDLAVLFDSIDPAWLGVQYDVRHATVEGAHSWPLALDLLAPRIHSLVVKDFRWVQTERGAAVEDVPIGKGDVDFAAFWHQIRALGLRRPVSMHFEYPMPGSAEPLPSEALRAQTMEVMQRDLAVLRKMLVQAGMG